MKVSILTSDNHSWLLKGFFHQWDKYAAGFDLIPEVVGFTQPKDLHSRFVSLGKFEDYPVQKWSDAIIKYLSGLDDDLVTFVLEDYWLIRKVNFEAIVIAEQYMFANPDVIRFDLAADRMFSKDARYIGSIGQLDLCEAKGPYSLSFQASIFRKDLLLKVLRENESPWQTEINGSGRLNNLPYKVVGSYQWPMNYLIVANKGQIDITGSWMYPARTISFEDHADLLKAGCLKREA